CPVCDTVLEGRYCPTCRTHQAHQDRVESLDFMDENGDPPVSTPSLREDDPDFDPMTLVASNVSVLEEIKEDVHLTIDDHEYPIADYLIDSLDDRGFLPVSPTEIASHLCVAEEHVVAVLEVIQDLAPVGVGA